MYAAGPYQYILGGCVSGFINSARRNGNNNHNVPSRHKKNTRTPVGTGGLKPGCSELSRRENEQKTWKSVIFRPSLFWAVVSARVDGLSLSRDLSSTLTCERSRGMKRAQECTAIRDGRKGEGKGF